MESRCDAHGLIGCAVCEKNHKDQNAATEATWDYREDDGISKDNNGH